MERNVEMNLVVEGFQKVLKELGELQKAKVEEYGIARYQEPDEKASMLMVYSDVYRKYIRLRGQILDHILHKDGRLDLSGIRESCRDLANYGGMGVQLADMFNGGGYTKLGPPLPPAIFGLEQIAFLNVNDMGMALKLLGADVWHHDKVVTRARVWGGEPIRQVANLAFNYQLFPGKELELISYESGDNWLAKSHIVAGLSHCGVHVENIDEATERLEKSVPGEELFIVQDAITLSHTNPHIKDTRRYRYRIFGTRRWLGFDLKLIQRFTFDKDFYGFLYTGNEDWMIVEI